MNTRKFIFINTLFRMNMTILIFKPILISRLRQKLIVKLTFINILLITLNGCQTIGSDNNYVPEINSTSKDQAYFLYGKNNISFKTSSVGTSLKRKQDLWQLTPSLFKLNLQTQRPRVRKEVAFFIRNPTFFTGASQRAHYYFHYVLKQLVKNKMPAELAMLPFIESGYNPFALSSANALGIWQFIPSTGAHYGLKNNWWYDGRRDITASTKAAITYLKDLNQTFKGDWLLTLAAYNCGTDCVKRAQKKNKANNKRTDYWSLTLPAETARYVPKLLAISTLIKHADHYGIKLASIPNRPYFNAVNVGSQIEIELAAKMANIKTQALYQLNPGFNRWATSPEGPHKLLIPTNKVTMFRKQLAKLKKQDKKVDFTIIKTEPNDTLAAIAARYNTSIEAIKALNTNITHLHNTQLRLPNKQITPSHFVVQHRSSYLNKQGSSQKYQQAQLVSKSDKGKTKTLYRVKSGDSLNVIAEKFSVSMSDIKRWNQQLPKNNYLRPNQMIIIFSKKSKSIQKI